MPPLCALQEVNRDDPRNQMPATAQQLPWPGQKALLSTERISSTIPKGGTDGTWTYPSPQMFYNALARKQKADDVEENDVDAVVQVHNAINEASWAKLLEWEMRHCQGEGSSCPSGPKLSRFYGKEDQLSPKARIMHYVFGKQLPFDRHDWIIDRCGKEVRYVIDYYHTEPKPGEDSQTTDQSSVLAQFEIDVRPALDSFEALTDRIMMSLIKLVGGAPMQQKVDIPSPKA